MAGWGFRLETKWCWWALGRILFLIFICLLAHAQIGMVLFTISKLIVLIKFRGLIRFELSRVARNFRLRSISWWMRRDIEFFSSAIVVSPLSQILKFDNVRYA